MFSFLKKRPTLNNEASNDLAVMLTSEKDTPIPNIEFFENTEMDLSLESLVYLDKYLESISNSPPEDEILVRLALRAGSYLGEVIRKESKVEYDWLEYKEAEKINASIKNLGFQLGTVSVLWSKSNSFLFPIAKVLKRINNGAEDNVHSFAKVVISGLPEGT